MGYDYLYKGRVYYRLSDGKFLVNLPNIKKQPDGDQIFNTEDEVKYAIDRALGEPCEYCEPYEEKEIDGKYGFAVITKYNEIVSFPDTDFEVCAVHIKIKFCPMCGRKLKGENDV